MSMSPPRYKVLLNRIQDTILSIGNPVADVQCIEDYITLSYRICVRIELLGEQYYIENQIDRDMLYMAKSASYVADGLVSKVKLECAKILKEAG